MHTMEPELKPDYSEVDPRPSDDLLNGATDYLRSGGTVLLRLEALTAADVKVSSL